MPKYKLTQYSVSTVIFLMLGMVASSAGAQESIGTDYGVVLPLGSAPESLVFDPATGDYTFTYKASNISDGQEYLVRLVYEPATKIDPSVASRFDVLDKGTFAYRYRVRNGKTAKQPINGILLFVRQADLSSQRIPDGWRGAIVSLDPLKTEGEMSVSWNYRVTSDFRGLPAGRTQGGFAFASVDLPGVGNLRLKGAVKKLMGFAGGGPDPESEVGKQFDEIRSNNFVSYPAAVPKIVVPTPYDGAIVLDNLRAHITQDIVTMKLIEPTLASQLDRSLEAAAEAIRRNNPKAARDHLHDAFKLIHKAHPNLDKDDADDDEDDPKNKGKSENVHLLDRLAARVIAFDIKYVEKRLKEEK